MSAPRLRSPPRRGRARRLRRGSHRGAAALRAGGARPRGGVPGVGPGPGSPLAPGARRLPHAHAGQRAARGGPRAARLADRDRAARRGPWIHRRRRSTPETFGILAWAMGRGSQRHGAAAFDDAWAGLGARHGFSTSTTARVAGPGAPRPRSGTPCSTCSPSEPSRPLYWTPPGGFVWATPRAALRLAGHRPGDRRLLRLLFGQGHPYAFSPPDAARARHRPPRSRLLHARLFQPARATLIIAGDVTVDAARERRAVAERLGLARPAARSRRGASP